MKFARITKPRPCKCGATPSFVHGRHGDCRTMRLTCKCGEGGATLLYLKPSDKVRMMQAGVDGWNYSH